MCVCFHVGQDRMGASLSSDAGPAVRAEAIMAAPPQGCPMHQEAQPAKGTALGQIRLPLYHAMSYHTLFNNG